MSATTMRLDRREVVRELMKDRGDLVVVAGLGSPGYDLFAAGDHDGNFYLWGAMGGAAMMGLGLALSQPSRRVLVLTGDGEMLMGLGSIATIAAQAPDNLSIVVLDNELYAETGMQPTHTARGVDLAGIAGAAGFAVTRTVRSDGDLAQMLEPLYTTHGTVFFDIKVSSKRYPMSIRLRDGAHIKNRFREALLGHAAFD